MVSPKVGSTKRGLADELQESPSAKRAKRAKHSKKRHSKGPKDDKDSDGYVEERDWVEFGDIGRSPIARKETPIKPPTPPFPLKKARKARVQKSAEQTKDEPKAEATKNEAKTKKGAKEGAKDPTAQDSSKTEANTRKTRAEPDLKGEPKHPIVNGNLTAPTIPGPSKPRVMKPAQEPKELTPLSDLKPRVDYTFKAFPNPPIIQFPAKNGPEKASANKPNDDSKRAGPKKESKNDSPKADCKKDSPKTTSTPPTSTTPMDMDIDIASLIPSEVALTAPAGTKTLKAINKHLKALEAKLTSPVTPSPGPDQVTQQELHALRSDIAQLHARLECDELRASIRHNMLFNALVKVSTDIGVLQGQIQEQQEQQRLVVVDGEGQNDDADGENNISAVNGTPARAAAAAAKDKRAKMMQQSRKTYEQCLRNFTDDMNRAGDREGVEKYGGLCVQYAGDLFKTLG